LRLTASISCAAIAGFALWAAERMNIKTGQWETTTTTQMTGLPPIPQDVLDKMTPQQRQMMEDRMKGTQTPHTSKYCVKQEDIDKALKFGSDDKECTRTIITSTGSRQEIKIECNRDNGKQTGMVRVEAASPEMMKGSMQMSMTSGGRSMNMNSTFSSRWLGATCSDK
jgi:hypothetical protein